MLKKDQTVFVLIDVQGKLAKIVHDSDALIQKLSQLIKGLNVLDVPMIWLEQYPKGLGTTIEEVAQHMPQQVEPISKITFNACKNVQFTDKLKAIGRKQVLVAGIEAHICVYQTAAGLKSLGYNVQVVEDAVSSRTIDNKQIGLAKMTALGISGTSVEMALYELMESADTPEFKEILKIIK